MNFEKKTQLIGFQGIDSFEREKVLTDAKGFFDLAEKRFKSVDGLQVHLKKARKSGERKKFFIFIRLILAGKAIESHSEDWVLSRGTRKGFDKLNKELEHRFKMK